MWLFTIVRDRHARIDLKTTQSDDAPFWQTKTLAEMTRTEWEHLCDGCGRCCMLKLEDEDTGIIHLSRVACKLLDISLCRCRDYTQRHHIVPDCLKLSPAMVDTLSWLPPTCAYRLVHEQKPLAWWHPLVSGSQETVHEAGISVREWAIPETEQRSDKLYRYLIIEEE